MAAENFPRYSREEVEMVVDVEHHLGIWMVEATFRHEEASNLAVECVGYARRGLFGVYRKRAKVRLRSQATRSSKVADPYRLERMRVHTGKHGVHDLEPPPRLGFFLEEIPGRRPGLPEHEKNVPRYSPGEEVSLRVRASHPDGVAYIWVGVSLVSWKQAPAVHLRGEGDGSKECEALLAGRIKDLQPVGRYRAAKMYVYAADPLLKERTTGEREEPLNPPLVFEVIKGEDAPPPPAEEPEKPNWGFAD